MRLVRRMYFWDLRWISRAREVVRVRFGRLGSSPLSTSWIGDFLALSV